MLPPPSEAEDLPQWWPELLAAHGSGQKVVVVTQGTVAVDPDDLIPPTMRALAGDDVFLVAWSGAGIALQRTRPQPARIGAAVREVLSDPRYAARARELQASGRAGGGLGRVVEVSEALVGAGEAPA